MDKINILLTGGNGYIAKSLKENLNYNITTITRTDFDLCDNISTNLWFKDKFFDIVIHTAVCGGSRLKTDEHIVLKNNIKMYNNLYDQKDHFNKFITFGSGAELFASESPYGKSKKIIAESIYNTKNFYNLRIFGVFDENELSTRFIKANLIRYLKKEPIIIHSNKIMDFYYMKDLISLVDYFIKNNNTPKEVNCSYDMKFTLKQIAEFINSLDNYKVPVIIENQKHLEFYCDSAHDININEIGLKQGIINTYNILKNRG
jgi:nucleoside-diphosphate-sugar epimerase